MFWETYGHFSDGALADSRICWHVSLLVGLEFFDGVQPRGVVQTLGLVHASVGSRRDKSLDKVFRLDCALGSLAFGAINGHDIAGPFVHCDTERVT